MNIIARTGISLWNGIEYINLGKADIPLEISQAGLANAENEELTQAAVEYVFGCIHVDVERVNP